MKPQVLVCVCILAMTMFVATQAEAQVWHVDKSATGANNGSSWQNAFTTIQPAIDAAWAAGGGQVWVAGGPVGAPVAYNEVRTENWGGVTGSLVMKDNVHVYGGFEGWRGGVGVQETLLSQRKRGVNIAVIDGSIARGGSPAYHVVVFGRGAAATSNAQLHGFHITGGNASGVAGNYHTWRGGGIYVWQSTNVQISECYIYGNTAAISGGGVANERGPAGPSSPVFENCVIAGNAAQRVATENATPPNPIRGGGGVFNNKSSPTFRHVTIADNTTGATGAMAGFPNYGLNSGGVYNWGDGAGSSTPVLLSSIIWGNTGTAGILDELAGSASATVTFSDVQGGVLPGAGNISANPNFSGSFPWAYQITGAPCVDVASSTVATDIRGVARPLGAQRDMGAYEYSANGPVAVCQAHTVNLDAGCSATMTAANIDGGSSAQAGIWKIVASQTTFGSADIPSKSVTLTVYDNIGRTATCNATVTVNDPIAPVITFCPGDQYVNANASCVAPAPNLAAQVTATDNCGIASITQVPVAGTLLPLGPTLVTMTVTDVGGNTAQCQATVYVEDNTPPVILTCPPAVNLVPDPSCNVTVPNFIPSGSYTDNCGIASVVQDPLAGSVVQGTTTVTITVTDTAGLTATCQTAVIVNDTTNPVAVCQNITVNLSSPTINGQAIDGGSTDNCGIATWLIDGAPTKTFTCSDMPSTVVTLTVLDAAGNSATCNATVTVVDDVNPVAVPQNVTVNLSAPTIGAAAIDGGSTDNCGITTRLIDGAANRTFTCANLGANGVTLRVEDAAGNVSTAPATVTVVDDIAPVAVCQNITVNLSSPTVAAAAIDGGSTDNCGITTRLIDGAANRTFTCSDRPSAIAVLRVEDAHGNFHTCVSTVTVVDDVAPVITRNGDALVTIQCGSTYVDAGATALDNCDGNISANIVTVNPVNTAVLGDYTVRYNVSDAAGNPAAEVTRTVRVIDTTAPVITLTGDAEVWVECGDPYNDLGATALDNCDGNITGNIVTVNPVDTGVVDTYTVTYNVSDSQTNAATQVTRTVHVIDTTVPIINLNGNAEVWVECGAGYTDAGATAVDVCAGSLIPNVVSTVDANDVGMYTVTYTVDDGNGNSAVPVVRTVHVQDTLPPVITRQGDGTVYVQLGEPYTDAGATAFDQCSGDITASIVTVNPVDENVPAVYTVTYNVTDGADIPAAQRTRTVIVSDTSQPDITVVTVESPLTVLVTYNKDMDGGIGMMDPANYTVSGSGQGTLSEHPDSVERVSGTVYRLVWTRPDEMFDGGDIEITVHPDVEDSAGNFMRYNVGEDSEGALGQAPVLTLNGGDETLECGVDSFVEAGASAEDDVDGDVAVLIDGDDLVDTQTPGVYVVTYTAADAAGNTTTDSRTVTVEDNTAPEIALNGSDWLELECNQVFYVEAYATAWDACDGDLTSEIILGGAEVNTGVLGSQVVLYSVQDGEGNLASVEREVVVVDTTAPDLVLLGTNPYVTADGALYVEPGAAAWDICEGDLTDMIVIGGDDTNTDAVGVYFVTYSVMDGSMNESTATRSVVVKPEGCEMSFDLDVTPNPAVPGSRVEFTVVETGGSCSVGALSYNWQKREPGGKAGFASIPDAADSDVFVIESVAFADAGTYKCSVSDASDTVDSAEVTLFVGSGVPAAGALGLALVALVSAVSGAVALRRRS